MRFFADILALLTGIAGWYYLFYSAAADRLAAVEPEAVNRRRGQLRRTNGLLLLLLGAGFYAGFNAIDPRQSPGAFLLVWGAVLLLLVGVVALALADIRFTSRLRRKRREDETW